MPPRIEVHPTAKVAAYAVGGALLVAVGVLGLRNLLGPDAPISAATSNESAFPTPLSGPLLAVIDLQIADASRESNWSAALAAILSGRTEVSVEGGRVDVL